MKKLNGYRPTHRNKWFLIYSETLSYRALLLFEYYLDIFDFDIHHDTFGEFHVSFSQIRELFRIKSDNTIRSWHDELLATGLIQETNRPHIFLIKNPLRYINPGLKWKGEAAQYASDEKDQSIGYILKKIGSIIQPLVGNTQKIENNSNNIGTNNIPRGIASSKDNQRLVQTRRRYPENHWEQVRDWKRELIEEGTL